MTDADYNKAHGGKTVYGACVGILMLETRFPRIPGDIGHAATWPFPVLYKVVRGATGERVTALGRSCAGAGGVFSREYCGQALVRHPDEGVHLAKFPGKLAPGIARIGAAEDLTVDATGQQKIGVGSVRGQVPDRAVGG